MLMHRRVMQPLRDEESAVAHRIAVKANRGRIAGAATAMRQHMSASAPRDWRDRHV